MRYVYMIVCVNARLVMPNTQQVAYGKGKPASFAYAIGSTLSSNLLFQVCLGIQERVLGFEPGTQKHCHSGEILYRPRQPMTRKSALLAASMWARPTTSLFD